MRDSRIHFGSNDSKRALQRGSALRDALEIYSRRHSLVSPFPRDIIAAYESKRRDVYAALPRVPLFSRISRRL